MVVTLDVHNEYGNDTLLTRIRSVVDNQPRKVKVADYDQRRVFAAFSIAGDLNETKTIYAGPSGQAVLAQYRGSFNGSTGNFTFNIDDNFDIIKQEFWVGGTDREIVTFLETLCLCEDMFAERRRYF